MVRVVLNIYIYIYIDGQKQMESILKVILNYTIMLVPCFITVKREREGERKREMYIEFFFL